jgi:NAD+ diphosphatase
MVRKTSINVSPSSSARFVVLAEEMLLTLPSDDVWSPFMSELRPQITVLNIDVVDLFEYTTILFQGFPCDVIILKRTVECGGDFAWESIRGLISRGALNADGFQLISAALQHQHWVRDHQFCGRCGQTTMRHTVERAMVCADCDMHYYPRLSPCIITVVAKGEYCLLALHQKARSKFYSALAGFVEVGESLEQALQREVMEEVGLSVSNLRYFGSQPWPFPGQLMIGFHADFAAGEIVIDGKEIVDAQWWHYRDLPTIPSASTLSGQLIRSFVERCYAAEG